MAATRENKSQPNALQGGRLAVRVEALSGQRGLTHPETGRCFYV